MAKLIYIQSVKNSSIIYRVVRYDAETKTATMIGRGGAEFVITPFTKEKLEADGYALKQGNEAPADLA